MTPKAAKRPSKSTQRRTSAKEAKFQGALARNWENCHDKYRAWQPNDRYRFTVKQMKEMEEIAQEDFATALRVHEDGGSKTKAASEAKMPYSLFEYMLERHQKEEQRRDLAERAQLDPVERLEGIRDALLTEVESRLDGQRPNRHLGEMDGLIRSCKNVTLILSRMYEGEGDLSNVTMNVITRIPEREYDNDPKEEDDEESVY